MAFLDSFKRRKEADIKKMKSISSAAANRISESTHSKQMSFRSAADLIGSREQNIQPL